MERMKTECIPCLFCHIYQESAQHMLLECPMSRVVWFSFDIYDQNYMKSLEDFLRGERTHILYKENNFILIKKLIICHEIWLGRCNFKYQNMQVDPYVTRGRVIHSIIGLYICRDAPQAMAYIEIHSIPEEDSPAQPNDYILYTDSMVGS